MDCPWYKNTSPCKLHAWCLRKAHTSWSTLFPGCDLYNSSDIFIIHVHAPGKESYDAHTADVSVNASSLYMPTSKTYLEGHKPTDELRPPYKLVWYTWAQLLGLFQNTLLQKEREVKNFFQRMILTSVRIYSSYQNRGVSRNHRACAV